MLKAYKYRIYPTKSQITLIEKQFVSAPQNPKPQNQP